MNKLSLINNSFDLGYHGAIHFNQSFVTGLVCPNHYYLDNLDTGHPIQMADGEL